MASLEFHSRLMKVQRNLLSLALMLTSNRKSAYDLVQDTTVSALKVEDTLQSGSEFKTRLFAIMRGIFTSRYHRAVRPREYVDHRCVAIAVDGSDDVPEGCVNERSLMEAIGAFSDDYRVPFTMHLTGYRYEEISSRTGIPVAVVRSRILVARRKIQSQFADFR